jgi:HlyD family secretion protein
MKRKYIWITVAIVLVLIIGVIIRSKTNKAKTAVAYTVANQDVKQTVIATGTVTSQANLVLGFKGTGTISQVNVQVGDKVRQGQVLMQLDESTALAAIQQAKAGVVSAQANYDKTVNGSSSQQVAVQQAAVQSAQVALQSAQTAYTNTVSQQQTAVTNAQTSMFNAGLVATSSAGNSSTAAPTVTGTYTGAQQGSYSISLYVTGSGLSYTYSGLESGSGVVTPNVPLALGSKGLFITFASTANLNSSNAWTLNIPNMQSAAYLTASNAYQAALQTQQTQLSNAQNQINSTQAALQQTQAQLALDQAPARPEDLESAQGQLDSAEAALTSAQNTYNNNIIAAPIDGTISAVDGKVGEQPGQTPITIIDQNSLHVESEISESSIALVQQGQSIDMTFDAFGPDKHYSGSVLSIDPASTVISGVTDFRVVSSLPANAPEIKTGMSVNLSILSNEKPSVLAVPNRLIQSKSSGQQFVSVVQSDGKTVKNVNITTGLSGDTYTEITSGLNSGEQIAAPANS